MTTDEQKLTLHNREIEQIVLSNLLNYSNLMGQYAEAMNEELFFDPKHKVLFRAICAVYDNGEAPDMINTGLFLMQHPETFAPEAWEVAEISGKAASSVNFSQNIEVLADMSKRRKYWTLGHKLIAAGIDPTLSIDEVDKDIDDIREQNLQAARDVYNMKAVNKALTERVEQNFRNERATMIPTGYEYIDEKGGFQLTDFNVIAGSTSQGKTTLAVNIMVNAAIRGIPCMFFTLEMTVVQLGARINAPLSGISSGLILFKKLYTDQLRALEQAKATSDQYPIYIDDTSTSYEKIKDSIRANAIKRGVKLFIIDYLQVLSSTRNGRESEAQFFERVSRELKNLAKELKVCIVPLSQMNREVKDADPRPTLSKMKASSGIEQAADTVLMVYRPGYYGKRHKYRPDLDPDKTSEIIVGKGRNIGGTGSFYVGFKPELSQFYDLEPKNDDIRDERPQAEQGKLPF